MKKLLMAGLALCMVANLSLLGMDISAADKKLVDAAIAGNLQALNEAIAAGANLDVQYGCLKNTPLIWATLKGPTQIVDRLIESWC